MDSHEYNAHVAEARRHIPLRGVTRDGGGIGEHHWRTSAAPDPDTPLLWRVTVGAGAVNDRVAAISYLTEADPRGWVIPDAYAGAVRMRAIYGPDYPLVDRSLLERDDPPFLLLTAPGLDAVPGSAEAGDFVPVPVAARPQAFRTAEAWENELWRASVFVSATPLRASRVETALHFPLPTRNRRWRVMAGQLPTRAATVGAGGHHELARLYLERTPGKPEADILHIQQRCFWSLWNTNAEPDLLGNLNPFLDVPTFGGIGAGLADGFGQGLAAAINTLTEIILAGVNNDLEQAATSEFWSV